MVEADPRGERMRETLESSAVTCCWRLADAGVTQSRMEPVT